MIQNRNRRHMEPPRLNLTAMVDVFTVLLVFLLKSYSAEGAFSTPVPVNPPSSTSNISADLNLVVTITERELFLGNSKILDPSFLSNENLNVPKLNDALNSLVQKTNFAPNQKKVTILGDKKIPFYVLKKVIYTFSQNGFSDISLAVSKKGG